MSADEQAVPTAEELKGKRINELAYLVHKDWKKVYFGAVPYLQAMSTLTSDDAKYGLDDAKGICTYFLSNAGTWRGPVAKAVKAELKRRFKLS